MIFLQVEFVMKHYNLPIYSTLNDIVSASDIASLVNSRLALHIDNWPTHCYDNPAAIRTFILLTMGDTEQETFGIDKDVIDQILVVIKHLSSNIGDKFRLLACKMLRRIFKSIDYSTQEVTLSNQSSIIYNNLKFTSSRKGVA